MNDHRYAWNRIKGNLSSLFRISNVYYKLFLDPLSALEGKSQYLMIVAEPVCFENGYSDDHRDHFNITGFKYRYHTGGMLMKIKDVGDSILILMTPSPTANYCRVGKISSFKHIKLFTHVKKQTSFLTRELFWTGTQNSILSDLL